MNTVLVEPLILDPLMDVATATSEPVVRSDLSLVDHVEVKLTAVLGETELTLADLFALKAGSVLPLAQGLDDAIVLQFNGKPVATATLVAVGDCFGVQIATIL